MSVFTAGCNCEKLPEERSVSAAAHMRVYAPPGPRQMIGKAHSPTVDGQKTETCLSTLFSTPRAPRFNVDRPHELTRFLEAPAGGGVNIEFGGHGGVQSRKKSFSLLSIYGPVAPVLSWGKALSDKTVRKHRVLLPT